MILPTHRVVKSLPASAIASFTDRAREVFNVEEIAHRDEFRARLNGSGSGAIGVALKGSSSYLILRLRSRAAMEAAMPEAAAEVRRLDVSVLHALVFDRIFRARRRRDSQRRKYRIHDRTRRRARRSREWTCRWCVPDESADRSRMSSG